LRADPFHLQESSVFHHFAWRIPQFAKYIRIQRGISCIVAYKRFLQNKKVLMITCSTSKNPQPRSGGKLV
ncbi:hypothetical protein N9L08_10010, partial [Rhodobacteraceae bacterium]|nr:hypothetical protein [Paracoccaceae bacterium]